MNKFKKLAGPASSLGTVTLVLAIALVALFITNNGFGWFSIGDHATAAGMRVDVSSPDTPVESYRFMMVHKAEFASTDAGEVYHRYAFTPLGEETAHMIMNNYSKLDTVTVAAGKSRYVAIIIYMPREVGNEANYRKGELPPQVKLGLTVYAQQAGTPME